jgi:hypothetical protein
MGKGADGRDEVFLESPACSIRNFRASAGSGGEMGVMDIFILHDKIRQDVEAVQVVRTDRYVKKIYHMLSTEKYPDNS